MEYYSEEHRVLIVKLKDIGIRVPDLKNKKSLVNCLSECIKTYKLINRSSVEQSSSPSTPAFDRRMELLRRKIKSYEEECEQLEIELDLMNKASDTTHSLPETLEFLQRMQYKLLNH